ncbi:hypothetical protein NDK50_00020 [Paraburkholderia bryophila]|uniref:hypothetical protein n=1 Tax=Paraburkholderia bryophila TaxID=420952 RepID=UPI0023499D31|nr:hypothetical protein [Paraburkholderia bryophila]WCM19911.1 hypothetical protein NDK50_00020 [Paraburkholderia bryophila]
MAGAGTQLKSNIPGPTTADIIDAMRGRCSWPSLRGALKKDNLPPGTGWAELGGSADDKLGNGPKLRQFLSKYFHEHIIAGERYVQLYDLPDGVKTALLKTLKAATVPASAFLGSYPLPLSSNSLLTAPSDPTLVEVRSLGNDDYALVYCSVRSYDDRTKYEYNQLPSQVKQTYQGIDELITVRKVHFQAYDVVIVRTSLERIEVCIDQPSKGIGNLAGVVLSVFGTMCNNLPVLKGAYESLPYNVFSAIAGIYFTQGEGTVRALSFRTLTGSRKREKMIKSDDDLRSEKFHHAGAQAVDNQLKPFELEVDWDSNVPPGKVEVAMKASIREVSNQDSQLAGFTVTADSVSLIAVGINKVIKYL